MASRTRSFFEQDKSMARPQHWNNSYHHNKAASYQGEQRVVEPRPPISANDQSRKKLKAFQFIEGQPIAPMSNGVDKENVPAEPTTGLASKHSSSAPRPDDAALKTPKLPHANTFPSTPAARLPLADLIGNFDDSGRRPAPREESPHDHIDWIPNSSNSALTPGRKRKRGRSSSPLSSSQRETEASRFTFGNAAGSQTVRTPLADPTADLWNRYEAGQEANELLKLPDFNHLMFQGSPQPLETPNKSSGLRRWASTGADWPSSKAKKRNTTTRTSINVWQEENEAAELPGGKSKVAAMVERIQESLATQKFGKPKEKPEVRVEGPSSSSPLPETGCVELFSGMPSASPLQARNAVRPVSRPDNNVKSEPLKHQQNKGRTNLDSDTDVENSQHAAAPPEMSRPASLHLQSKAPLPAFKRPSINRPPSLPTKAPTPVPAAAPVPAPAPPAISEDLDEFGEAIDLSVEDMEELLSQAPIHVQKSLYQIPQHPNPPPQQAFVPPQHPPTLNVSDMEAMMDLAASPIQNGDDFDFDFGDDEIDEESLVQAENRAAQAFRCIKSPRKRSPRKLNVSPRKSQQPSTSQRSPKKASHDARQSELPWASKYRRCVVTKVVDSVYTDEHGRRCPEKILAANEDRSKRHVAITLRGSWSNTAASPGHTFHIIPPRPSEPVEPTATSPPGQVTLHDGPSSSLLVLHPDHMLSATTVADSFDCIRKAVLQDRIKATSEANKAMVYGSVLHEVFQQALIANTWSEEFLRALVERTVEGHVEGLWELGMPDTVLAIEELTAKMAELSAWAKIFVAAQPSSRSVVDDKRDEKVWMVLSKLIAIEEHIWSPQYGLKGNVDATVQTTFTDSLEEPAKKAMMPFEVKTGRTTQSPAHKAQTALYTLLLSDRYDVCVQAGILYYMESSAMSRIAPPTNEVRQMVQQRNRLAAFLHRARHPASTRKGQELVLSQTSQESGLPGMLKNPFKCGRCYAQQACFTFHALIEGGSADTAGMIDDGRKSHSLIWKESIGHLETSKTSMDGEVKLSDWFNKWDRLLTLEESEMSRWRKELWTMSSAEREAVGRCFGGLVIIGMSRPSDNAPSDLQSTANKDIEDEGSNGKINRFTYTFARRAPVKGASFAEGSQLGVGEPIVVSSEAGQWALANGYVASVSRQSITVAVDRKLGDTRERLKGFETGRNEVFRGIMTVGEADQRAKVMTVESTLYRLDKDEFSNGLALVRNSLVQLMSASPLRTTLRRLVIFGDKPAFAAASMLPALPPSQLATMNDDQRAAVRKVLSAQDYALILGMPGTGKTTTIAHVIRALLAEGKSILLTSFTHTAVDNILLKLQDIAPPNSILRLGVLAKINTQVKDFCQLAATPRKTIGEIDETYMGSQIVATTCLGTNHPLFSRRMFDVCIVDEASQITLPTSLGPMLHARSFVLVGDHYQLPPLVQNRAAQEGGLDVSLFRLLSEAHPEAIATLGQQYRMCEDIMSLSNALVYNGQLRCGNEEVAQRALRVPHSLHLERYHQRSTAVGQCIGGNQCWLGSISSSARKVIFANTDHLRPASLEKLTGGKNITNQVEATLTAQLVLSLLSQGVLAKDIGVITLYRSQLALLRQLFRVAGIDGAVELDSTDRFQGRDKECIIISMVRSNEAGVVGELLKDWRRVNVAFTRARSKLVIFGSRHTLARNELLARFLRLVDERGWTLELAKGAAESHAFDFSTQSTAALVTQNSPTTKAGQSPQKEPCPQSPSKKLRGTRKVLGESKSIGNHGPATEMSLAKKGGGKMAARVIVGGKSSQRQLKLSGKDLVMDEIFRDALGEDVVLSQ